MIHLNDESKDSFKMVNRERNFYNPLKLLANFTVFQITFEAIYIKKATFSKRSKPHLFLYVSALISIITGKLSWHIALSYILYIKQFGVCFDGVSSSELRYIMLGVVSDLFRVSNSFPAYPDCAPFDSTWYYGVWRVGVMYEDI